MILDVNKIYTFKDTEKAKKLIGKKCYFFESLYDFENNNDKETFISILKDVSNFSLYPYLDSVEVEFSYIYPVEEEAPELTFKDVEYLIGLTVRKKTFNSDTKQATKIITSIEKRFKDIYINNIYADTFFKTYETLSGENVLDYLSKIIPIKKGDNEDA